MRLVWRALLGLVIAVVVAEGVLQVAALFAPDRVTERAGAMRRILCAGDSHTYGVGVSPEEAYPSQLQALLDAARPGTFSVINAGIPGMSTTQVLNRLPTYVSRFQPDTIVVWCGVNDTWNNSEVDVPHGRVRLWLHGLLTHLRLYRLVRVWQHDRQLVRDAEANPAELTQRPKAVSDNFTDPNRTMTVQWADGTEQIKFTGGLSGKPDEATEARAEKDYEAMVTFARGAGLRIVFITYPLRLPNFVFASRAMQRVAAREGVPLVDGVRAKERVPPGQLEWTMLFHPTAPLYREIARDVAAVVLDEAGSAQLPPPADSPAARP